LREPNLKTYLMRPILLFIIPALLLISCDPKQSTKPSDPIAADGVHKVEIKEVIQGATYTYARVSEEGSEYWLATAKSDLSAGAVYYYSNGTEMTQFQSKELERTFESIIFVDALSTEATLQQSPHGGMMNQDPIAGKESMGAPGSERADIKVQPAKGGISIAQLFESMDKYDGKIVKISGQVVKVNNGIMGTNWIHIQDGTAFGENFDLTVTSTEEFQVGDLVIFEGKISLNKDFGYGYKYPVIMEEGKGKSATSL
jgi:hypothetical protein